MPILAKMGAGTSPADREFFLFSSLNYATFRQLRNGRFSRNLVTKRILVSRRGIRKKNFENFHFRGHLPQNLKSKLGQTGTSLRAAGHGMHCREIMFTPRCSHGSGSFLSWSTLLCDERLRSYGASNLPNFRILAHFRHTKPLKRSGDQPTVQGLHRRMVTIFPCGRRRSKEVPSGRDVFLRLLIGEVGTPKLAQIFAYGKWLYPFRMLLHGASDLDQRSPKTRNSEDGCTFPPNIFAPTPKITPKPHFGGRFNAKPIIHAALRKSHVNGATKLKLYSYTGIGKYLG